VTAVERLARSDRRLAATVDQWDRDPWLLNTPDGTIDLRTGECRPHRGSDYITRITNTGAGGASPLWRTFLNKVTGGDEQLQSFLKRVIGCALTGITRDHSLFFLYGTGANGKSVFLNTIAGVLRDYHRTAPIEAFTATSMDRHPTELAGLRGARLVTAVETEEGRQWAESKIKALTGGDKVAARFMRQDFFEFIPQFKLMIAGNHKPGLRSVGEAIRRRLKLIPFTVTIPPAERDDTLAERLKSEWPGILAWAIEGCKDWQRQGGLAPPNAVTEATAQYLDEQDALSAWVGECCTLHPDARETATRLFKSWSQWAQAAGIPPGRRTDFLDQLRNRNFSEKRTNIGQTFFGLRVK
jgi:putative DNA primase/helicase